MLQECSLVNGRRDAYMQKTTVITPNPAHVNISAGGVNTQETKLQL